MGLCKKSRPLARIINRIVWVDKTHIGPQFGARSLPLSGVINFGLICLCHSVEHQPTTANIVSLATNSGSIALLSSRGRLLNRKLANVKAIAARATAADWLPSVVVISFQRASWPLRDVPMRFERSVGHLNLVAAAAG